MKYYYREHIAGYERMKAEGRNAWHQIHNGKPKPFDDFPTRDFLEATLPRLRLSAARPSVLEIGCGTGPGACFLAARGFSVEAIDIIPTAIDIATQIAAERGLDISCRVQDICELPQEGDPYDLIVDSFCLQGIVTDEDRARVFGNVRARLRAGGYYVVSTAMFDEKRFRDDETVVDQQTRVVYNRYGEGGIIDASTGIVYVELDEPPDPYEDALRVNDMWYLPNRRHLKAAALKAELEAAGFDVLQQSGQWGQHAVCVHAGSGASIE